jgi:hypothetical protein
MYFFSFVEIEQIHGSQRSEQNQIPNPEISSLPGVREEEEEGLYILV